MRADHGSTQIVVIAVVASMLIPFVAIAAVTTAAFDQADIHSCQDQPGPSRQAGDTIPPRYLRLYRAAGHRTGIDWTILAGIGKVESDHGRDRAPGIHSGTNTAGAAGPMQIGIRGQAGDTWAEYGTDADHDGHADVYDPADAIPAAAHYLKAHGAPTHMRRALFAYNNSTDYVDTVLHWAHRYTGTNTNTSADEMACHPASPSRAPKPPARKVIAYAHAQLGKPYVYGATGPVAYDCSGLTMRAYQAAGITIPRTAQAQWRTEPHVPRGYEQPGDLVFFVGAHGTPTNPDHVGIITSTGHMIDAPHTGTEVQTQPYARRSDIVGYARP